MNKLKTLLVLIMAVMLFSCTAIIDDHMLDKNSDTFNEILATDVYGGKDGTPNGVADAFDDDNFDGILNKDDYVWLSKHPQIDSVLNGPVEDPDNPDDPENPHDPDNPKDPDEPEPLPQVEDGKPYLAITGTYFEIIVGEEFDPIKDAGVKALDKDGEDAIDEVEVDGDFDTNTEGEYTINFIYGELKKTITLRVKKLGGGSGDVNNIGNFEVTWTHDYRKGNDIVLPIETLLDPPLLTVKVKESGEEVSPMINGAKSTIEFNEEASKTGEYVRAWTLINPDDQEDFATFEIKVIVTGPSLFTFNDDVFGLNEKEEDLEADVTVDVKLGDEFVLPATDEIKAVDGLGKEMEVTLDDGGFDPKTEGEYTVVYKAGNMTRTITLNVVDAEVYVIDKGNTKIELKEKGTYVFKINVTEQFQGILAFGDTNDGGFTVIVDGESHSVGYYGEVNGIASQGNVTITVPGKCSVNCR